jgi:large subunit ribosomal protein L19
MALFFKHKETEFGVGDKIRVIQKIEEGGKSRLASFEGMVLGFKGQGEMATIKVRRIGELGIGIERIFPLASPTIEKIEVIKKGVYGVRHAKLYYTRSQSPTEVEEIYSRSARKNVSRSNRNKPSKNAPKKNKKSKKRK